MNRLRTEYEETTDGCERRYKVEAHHYYMEAFVLLGRSGVSMNVLFSDYSFATKRRGLAHAHGYVSACRCADKKIDGDVST